MLKLAEEEEEDGAGGGEGRWSGRMWKSGTVRRRKIVVEIHRGLACLRFGEA